MIFGVVTVRRWEWLRERRSEVGRVAYWLRVRLLRASQSQAVLVCRSKLAGKDGQSKKRMVDESGPIGSQTRLGSEQLGRKSKLRVEIGQGSPSCDSTKHPSVTVNLTHTTLKSRKLQGVRRGIGVLVHLARGDCKPSPLESGARDP